MDIYFRDAGVLSVVFSSGDPFISGFPGLVQMILLLSDQWFSSDDGDISVPFISEPQVGFVVTQYLRWL